MHHRLIRILTGLLFVSACLVVAGCRSTDNTPVPYEFELITTPEQGNALPGERFVMLVTLDDETPLPSLSSAHSSSVVVARRVTITAECPGAVVTIEHPEIDAYEVAEIVIVPDADSPAQTTAVTRQAAAGFEPDWNITVTVTGERDGITHTATRVLGVITGNTNEIEAEAAEYLDRLVSWLEVEHPQSNITSQTEWTPAMPAPLLIVSHYLYYSDEWELHVSWHVMIEPYDWIKYELRRRFADTEYTAGYCITSRSAVPLLDPVFLEPENTLWR